MTQAQKSDYAALLLRVTTGGLFIAHGLLKVLVFTIPGTVGYFESLGLPAIFAYLTIFAEIIGGLALIIGFQTRLVSLGLVPILIGAAVLGHGANGWVFSNTGGGWEFPAFWALTQMSLVLLGDGAYAMKSRKLFNSAAYA
ncbi:MAG: DoxX family protein [Roseobacter sp.]|jgi:putative oxidoreductase|nr:DoxX family protein [Roseobacter sp.]